MGSSRFGPRLNRARSPWVRRNGLIVGRARNCPEGGEDPLTPGVTLRLFGRIRGALHRQIPLPREAASDLTAVPVHMFTVDIITGVSRLPEPSY